MTQPLPKPKRPSGWDRTSERPPSLEALRAQIGDAMVDARLVEARGREEHRALQRERLVAFRIRVPNDENLDQASRGVTTPTARWKTRIPLQPTGPIRKPGKALEPPLESVEIRSQASLVFSR